MSSWPALVAKKLDVELVNLARPAWSNDAILQDLVAQDINSIPNGEAPSWNHYMDLVVVCWTSHLRMQLMDDEGDYTVLANSKERGHRKQVSDLLSATNNQLWLYERWLTQVILAQHYLDGLHAKWLFFSAFDNQIIDVISDLHAKIDKTRFLGWPNKGFVEWAYPCKLGPRGHPLEDGHQRVADRVLQGIKDRYDIA